MVKGPSFLVAPHGRSPMVIIIIICEQTPSVVYQRNLFVVYQAGSLIVIFIVRVMVIIILICEAGSLIVIVIIKFFSDKNEL